MEGWPDNIPFINLSNVSSALPGLQMLLDKWEAGEICWRHLEESEYQKLGQEHGEKVSNDKVVDKCHQTCSDKGKKLEQPSDASAHRRKAYKSAATVVSDDESDVSTNTHSRKHSPLVNTPSSNMPNMLSPHKHSPSVNNPSGNTPPPHESTPSTPPTISSLHIPDIWLIDSLDNLINNDMFSRSGMLPGGSPGAGPSINMVSPEFNFDDIFANLDCDHGSMLDF
ncbi:hypothetical protein BDR05DRAFT_1004676 [Suillus weaverae]|nr:hypothetical protein BDR05DRAFT_1004676 [Suillus weaverae]